MKRPAGFDTPRRSSPPPAPDSPAPARDIAETETDAHADFDFDLDLDPEPRPAASTDVGSARALRAARRQRRRVEREEIRRFTRRSRRRRLSWIVGLGSVAVLVAGTTVAAYSPLMALTEIRVEGASRIDPGAVEAAVEPQLGTPLPLVDADRIAKALEAFPLIQTYSLESIPPGTLVLRIVERSPIGVLESATGFELVDAAGVVIERADAPQAGYPLIDALGGPTGAGFQAAGSVIRSLPAELRDQLVRVSANTADDVRLELTSGASIVWGSAERSAFKADVLTALMTSVPPDSVDEYDVSAPESPVTR